MNMFRRFFGGVNKEDPNNVTPAQAIQNLFAMEEKLNKRQEFLAAQIELEKANAVRYSKKGDKLEALNALKRKKKHETDLIQTGGTLTTLEMQREALQDALSNVEVVGAMKQASGALENATKLDAEDVHELMDKIDEQRIAGQAIGIALSAPGLRTSDIYNDADLERELLELQQEDEEDPMLPDIPTKTIKTREEDDQLRELQQLAE